MALPKTYLLAAPSDAVNPLGTTMLWTDLVNGIRRINNNVVIPMPEHFARWYPGQSAGMTCLWLGPVGTGRKITAFHLGAVPEFTQVAPGGDIIAKGWRAVFAACVRARACTRRRIEREFKVSLEVDGKDRLCAPCFRNGDRTAVPQAGQICSMHSQIAREVVKARELKDEAQHLSEHGPGRFKGKTILSKR
jgi:hypothetical protein